MTDLSTSLPDLRPNLVSYNSLIAAHANSNNNSSQSPSNPIQSAQSAHDVLLTLFNLYKLSDGDLELRLDRVAFTTVLTAYARISCDRLARTPRIFPLGGSGYNDDGDGDGDGDDVDCRVCLVFWNKVVGGGDDDEELILSFYDL